MIRKYLKKICSESERISQSKTRPFEAGSVRHISKWLNKQVRKTCSESEQMKSKREDGRGGKTIYHKPINTINPINTIYGNNGINGNNGIMVVDSVRHISKWLNQQGGN